MLVVKDDQRARYFLVHAAIIITCCWNRNQRLMCLGCRQILPPRQSQRTSLGFLSIGEQSRLLNPQRVITRGSNESLQYLRFCGGLAQPGRPVIYKITWKHFRYRYSTYQSESQGWALQRTLRGLDSKRLWILPSWALCFAKLPSFEPLIVYGSSLLFRHFFKIIHPRSSIIFNSSFYLYSSEFSSSLEPVEPFLGTLGAHRNMLRFANDNSLSCFLWPVLVGR